MGNLSNAYMTTKCQPCLYLQGVSRPLSLLHSSSFDIAPLLFPPTVHISTKKERERENEPTTLNPFLSTQKKGFFSFSFGAAAVATSGMDPPGNSVSAGGIPRPSDEKDSFFLLFFQIIFLGGRESIRRVGFMCLMAAAAKKKGFPY